MGLFCALILKCPNIYLLQDPMPMGLDNNAKSSPEKKEKGGKLEEKKKRQAIKRSSKAHCVFCETSPRK